MDAEAPGCSCNTILKIGTDLEAAIHAQSGSKSVFAFGAGWQSGKASVIFGRVTHVLARITSQST